MKNNTTIHMLLRAALIVGATTVAACTDSGDANDDGSSGDTGNDTGTATTPTTDTMTTAVTMTTADTADSTGNPTTDPTATTDPTDPTNATSDGTTGGEGFNFPDDPYTAYTQIDRHGAVEAGTAGIAAPEGLGFNRGSDITIRDAYNASNPAEDVDGMWLGEISDSVTFFHDALDDDIIGLGLTPASVETALAQAGPVVVPDAIKYDPSMPTAYPNGRRLEDQVVDITLAAVMLELGPGQPLSFFADLPLNPEENDVPFEEDFPYLAAPHVP